MTEKDLILLEKRIRLKMKTIENGEVAPKDSGIAPLFNILKKYDEVLYNELLVLYKDLLLKIKK
jgi:hypothetical protein